MSTVPDSLRILASLRKLDEDGFAWLMHARRVNVRGVEDLLDLAEWLETPANIAAAFARLDWPTLRGLRLKSPNALQRAVDLQLAISTGPEIELLPEAQEQLATLVPTVPSYSETARTSLANGDTTEAAGTASAHRVAQLANDALWLLAAEPRVVRRTRDQARMSGVEIRRLATELETDPVVTASLYRWLYIGGFVAPVGDAWHLTEAGAAFAAQPILQRWRSLIDAWLTELTIEQLAAVADVLDGSTDPSVDFAAEPISADDATYAKSLPATVVAQLASAAALGIVERRAFTMLGGHVLDSDVEAAIELLDQNLPQEISRVYVQPDQTILAPGPLSGELDQQLRRVAQLERRALASEYRLTPKSLTHAFNSGMDANGIRAFLESISLTGIPQPVDYLIGSTSSSHGRVRVLAASPTAGKLTKVITDDTHLRDAIAVDAGLGTLSLQRAGDALVSRVSPNVVLAALLDARYPAVLEGHDGNPVARRAQAIVDPAPPTPGPTAAKTATLLAEQAAASDHADDRITWIQRRLEIARRNKAEVHVSIDVPGKDPVLLALIPLSVGAQRLRALDLDADVERTLPMRSILSIDGS